MRTRLLPLLIALPMAGCVHVSETVLVDRSDQPVPMEEVRAVFDDDEVPETCESIAYLHGEASEDFSDDQDIVDKFRKKAGKLGANLVSIAEVHGGSGAISSVFESSSDREFDAEAYWCVDGPGT